MAQFAGAQQYMARTDSLLQHFFVNAHLARHGRDYGAHRRLTVLRAWTLLPAEQVRAAADRVVSDMHRDRLDVQRMRIATLTAQCDTWRQPIPEPCYFEFRFACALSTTRNAHWLAQQCVPHGAHLVTERDGDIAADSERTVVTLRCYAQSMCDAHAALERLLYTLRSADTKISWDAIDTLYVLHDSRVSLDRDWLYAGQPAQARVRCRDVYVS